MYEFRRFVSSLFWTTVFILVVLWIFREVREYRAQKKRAVIESYLRANMPADKYADYVLIRDGFKK